MKTQAEIIIKGIVQGVGFRPFISKLVRKFALVGYIENREFGVKIVTVGNKQRIQQFYNNILHNNPQLSVILEHSLTWQSQITYHQDKFIIKPSKKTNIISTYIPPDIATCNDCLKEILDRNDRRFHYPFTNCTNCGPRFTIIKKLPYDRQQTTMHEFPMCDKCRSEYENIDDRRYHAQPNSCSVCGPRISFVELQNKRIKYTIEEDYALQKVIELLKNGDIVAIKGLGGFHIACDALNSDSVRRLRRLKSRPQKPFALMADSIETIEKYANINDYERELLTGQIKPIVLLTKNSDELSHIAPGLNQLGFMLAYTPLHHLLLQETKLLVMTSGNISEQAIERDNRKAMKNLSGITNYFLLYNREIYNRCDDSIVKFAGDEKILVRRARGYVPVPMTVKIKSSPVRRLTGLEIMGAGGDLKASFGLWKNNLYFGSQYLGDLQFLSNQRFYKQSLDYFENLFEINPQVIIADKHPDYFSGRIAKEHAESKNIKLYYMQHHKAHIYSVMAERNLQETIGVAFDGTGFGDDGQIWGGEFFVYKHGKMKRVAHLQYVPLISGEKSIKEPWRMGLTYLYLTNVVSGGVMSSIIDKFYPKDKFPYQRAITKLLTNSPIHYSTTLPIYQSTNLPTYQFTNVLTSSIGRLFDAVASIVSVCHYNSYEGESAMKLQSLILSARDDIENETNYSWKLDDNKIPWQINILPMIDEIVMDISKRVSVSKIAMKFHFTIIEIIIEICRRLRRDFGVENVSLSGGVFQNDFLVQKSKERLLNNGFSPYFNNKVPPNDAGISLGQIYGYLLNAEDIVNTNLS